MVCITNIDHYSRECDCFLYEPQVAHALATTPGIFMDPTSPSMTDTLVRFAVSHIVQSTRRGARFSTGEQVAGYLENPKPRYSEHPPGAYKFPVSSTDSPCFSKTSGMNVVDGSCQLGKLVFFSGKRKGKCIDLSNRKKMNVASNCSTAPPKYTSNANPMLKLSPTALPVGTPTALVNKAQESFSCSIARNTQSNYCTAIRHLKNLES